MANSQMPIGVTDFKKTLEEYYFVDKTDFLRQFLDGHSEVTLITRPRRFGKSMLMSMVDWFFAADKRERSQGLFDHLAIARAGQAYMDQRGSRPVISVSLKAIGGLSWQEMQAEFQTNMQISFDRYRPLLKHPALDQDDRDFLRGILSRTAPEADYKYILKRLAALLQHVYAKPVVILIDEYDAPLQHAWENGYYKEAIEFYRGMYNVAFKENEYLDFAVLTGVLRIAKESIFSGLNSLDVCPVTRDLYASACGFTPAEVAKMAEEIGFQDKLPELQAWYDGYHFGSEEIYNPWSVINYVHHHFQPRPYWMNTSANGILKNLLSQADRKRIAQVQGLLEGKSVRALLREGMIYADIGRHDEDLFSMMLTTGYLTPVDCQPTDSELLTKLVLPNKEVRSVYAGEILQNLSDGLERTDFYIMLEDMLEGNSEEFEEYLQLIIQEIASAFDTAVNKQESFYHGLMLGLTAMLHGRGYQVKSNGEAGYGRFDIAIFPLTKQGAGVVLEFKTAADTDGLMIAAQEAVQQIAERDYLAEFRARGVETVWAYGIGFAGKNIYLLSRGSDSRH